MKDIGNYKLLQVHEALQRLAGAVDRLETAANDVAPALPMAREAPALRTQFDQLVQDHTVLKATAGRVAVRLDAAIARLAGSLESEKP